MKIRLVGKPKNAPYLTPGKVYDVLISGTPRSAAIRDDEGDEIGVHLPGHCHPCPHARPAHWEVVE